MQCKTKSKLLLFDLDGTLILSGGAGFEAWRRLFKRFYGIEDAMRCVDGRGKTDPNILREAFLVNLKRAPTAAESKTFFAAYEKSLKSLVRTSAGYRMIEGIDGLLKALYRRKGLYLALGTGNVEVGARIKLSRARLNRFFPVGGFADDSSHRPTLLRKAAAKAARYYKTTFKGGVYVIGDTPLDVAAGKACGFVTAVIDSGVVARQELIASKPDHFFDSYERPQEWIERLGL